jgi:HAD superfamily hydrolase (TIGR01484 family)
MQSLSKFDSKIQFLFTDIDDTLTDHGRLGPEAYNSLWQLQKSGIHVIPITGRPAGWCEMIARMWPVAGVIGENGGFYFRYKNKNMYRFFSLDESEMLRNRTRLDQISQQILAEVPGSAIASDQFCRMMDLAIDFCEDVPALTQEEVKKIVEIFERAGALAKISSIHVNGWFGNYNKVTAALEFLNREFSIEKNEAIKISAFAGDSPNDEPMFEVFPLSFAVANINKYLKDLKHKPQFLANQQGGLGFAEITNQILLTINKQILK